MRDSRAPSALGAVPRALDEGVVLTGKVQPATKAADASKTNPRRMPVISRPQPDRSSASRILRGSTFVRLAVKTRSHRALL